MERKPKLTKKIRVSSLASRASGRGWSAILVGWLAVVLLVLTIAPPVRGQTESKPKQPSEAEKATAREAFHRGNEKFKKGNYQGALREFEAADAIMGVPTTGYKVGLAQAQVGRLVEALNTLSRVGRYPKLPNEPKPFTQARQNALQLADQVLPRIPSLVVTVRDSYEIAGLGVSIDGRDVPAKALGFPYKVNPGQHVVSARAPGYVDTLRTVHVKEKQELELELVLTPAESGSPNGSGGISPLAWVGFGVGAAGLALGAITGGLALSKEAALADECPDKVCPPDKEDQLDSAVALSHVSTAGFVVGAVGLGVGTIALLLTIGDNNEPSESSNTALGPRLRVGLGSIEVFGRF